MNTSFGAEDGLQQLQIVVDNSEAPAFAKLPELVVNYCKQLLNYARTRQRARQREKQRIGQNLGQVKSDHVLALVLVLCPACC